MSGSRDFAELRGTTDRRRAFPFGRHVSFEDAMKSLTLASIMLLTVTAVPAIAGNTSSNTSSNTSCNSSNGRTTCLRTYDRSVTTDRYRARDYRGSVRIERHARSDDRYWRDRPHYRWQFGGDDD